MKHRTSLLIAGGILLVGTALFLRFFPGSAQIIWNISGEGTWLLPLVITSAIIDSINPCAFSILLVTIAFLFGLGKTRGDLLKIGGTYIAGIFAAYLLIGLGILQALHLFNTPHFMGKVGAFLLIGLGGIGIVNQLFPQFPIKFGIPHAAHRKIAELMRRASLPAAFALGALVGLCEFPCTGGPYLMILGLLHDNTTAVPGLGYLVLYNAIFVLPLLVMLFVASTEVMAGRVRAWQRSGSPLMHLGGGVAMVILGILIFLL